MDGENYNQVFVSIVVGAIAVVLLLGLSGAFDGNKKSSSQVYLQTLSDCNRTSSAPCEITTVRNNESIGKNVADTSKWLFKTWLGI